MAERPVFVPIADGDLLVDTHMIEFAWFPGMSLSQKQKSIASLHEAACSKLGLRSVLEISTKSPDPVGVSLSAFNLNFIGDSGKKYPLESIYQSSKVFSGGGPYRDIREKSAIDAKQDPRLKESGQLIAFFSASVEWPLEPKTVFYDWLYLNVLIKLPTLSAQLSRYAAFTDIEFNPKKSINCQAYSAALFLALEKRGLLTEALRGRDAFVGLIKRFLPGATQENTPVNGKLI